MRSSEPFTTQLILNEIINKDFTIGVNHFSDIIYQFIPMSSSLGAETTSFNELFQPALFPQVETGMANNIWAEMWSSGGWGLLILFIIFYNITVFIGTKIFLNSRGNLKGIITLLMTYWTFYIHRNTLFYQINLMKRPLLIWGSVILTIIYKSLTKEKHRQNLIKG